MEKVNIGPLLSDEEFYSSLCPEAFDYGDKTGVKECFYKFIKNNLDKNKFFSAIGFDPCKEPDELTKKQAEDALEYNMVSCDIYHKFDGKIDWYSNHTYNKYEEWTWQLSRHRQVLDLSWVYFYTKDEKYAERAVEILDSWIKQAVVPSPDTDGHTTLCWRTIECGIRMNLWAKCIIMLIDSPYFTPDFCVDFFKSVYEHAERLYHKYTAANWLTIEMNGLYVVSLLYPFFKRSRDWRDLAKSTFIKQINEQTLDDGTHYELTFGFQRVTLVGFFDALRLGIAFGDEFPDEYIRKLRSHLYAIVSVMTPGGDTPNVNDGKLIDVRESIKKFCSVFPNDGILNFAISENRSALPSPPFLSLLLKNAGFAMFRSDWTENAIAGFFDGGKFGRCHNHEDVIRCHQHEDKLNFLMYVGKKNIICEAESYAYDTSQMRYHVLSSAAHNTALINGKGQSRLRKNHWDNSMLSSVENIDFVDCGEIEYSKATYDEGYGDQGEVSATHERTVYFVKKPRLGQPYFIIKDKIFSENEVESDVVWHFDTEKLEITDHTAICPEITALFAGNEGDITVYCGSEDPFAGWKANSFTQGDFRGVPTVYYHMTGNNVVAITAFVPNVNDECSVSSLDYIGGVISVTYTDGEKLSIDF